jgi:hypothetical protein
LRGLINNGARTVVGAGFVLALLGNTTALADLQVDQTLERAGSWTIGYNASLKGCVASASSDDSTTIWIGFEGSETDSPAYLAFTNPNWRSIEARKFYELEIQVSGAYRWKGYSSGVERPNEKGLFVFGVKRRALQDFARAPGLVLSVNKELLAQTRISGLSDAIEKLMDCQEHRLAALKNRSTKNPGSVAETPKQSTRATAEPPSAASQMSDDTRPAGALLARLEEERNGPNEQAKPLRAEAEAHAQTIGRMGRGDASADGEAPMQVEAQQVELPGSEAGKTPESAQQDQPERDRIAHAPDAKAEEAFDRTGRQAIPLLSPDQPAIAPELKGEALVRAIKQELKRVGCYSGLIDNDWQMAPARASIRKFARLTGLTIPVGQPTHALLDVIKVRTERICPPEPAAYPSKRNVRHVTRKCPGGFERDEDGGCPARRKAMIRQEIDNDDDRPRARSHEAKRRGRVYSD